MKCISFEVDFIRFPRINYDSNFFSVFIMPDDGRERDSSREQMEFILTVKAETLHSQANSLDFYVQKKNIERKEQTETT